MIKFTKKILKSGLTVLHEKRDVPVTTVMLATKYGSAYESENEKGIAHFIEHLCFKGTAKRSTKEIAEGIENVGGILNAFTSEEITSYHAKLPSEHLEKGMEIIFDIFFNPVFPEEEVGREAKVICEEIKMYSDNPQAHVLEKIKENLYGKPFGMFGAGTAQNVLRFKREDLLNKHREVYVPKNSILCVVGNNDFSEIVSLAEKFLVLRKEKIPNVPKIEQFSKSSSEKRKVLQQTNLALGIHFPFSSDKDRYAAEVFCSVLGEGMSSKLFEEVREKRGLVYGIKSSYESGKNYGFLIIFAGTNPDKVEEVKRICQEEFSKIGKISEEELRLAKEKVVGSEKVSSENSESTAVDLILEEIAGDAKNFYSFEKKIGEVSLRQLEKFANKKDFAFFSLGP